MVTTLAQLPEKSPENLLNRYQIKLHWVTGENIPGSHWGAPEAGIIGQAVYARTDTPVHSLLHESCHIICMDGERRRRLQTNAGGSALEESAVCYLQILLADALEGYSQQQTFKDMDKWGYSFRLGSTQQWFEQDAEDAVYWLWEKGLIDGQQQPTFKLRA